MKLKKSSEEQVNVPTRAELDVLKVLWKHGPSTVRFVHDALNEQKEAVQYTSTLKLMQVMTEKGMLLRDETNMKHVYTAALEEEPTKRSLLNRFVEHTYEGSVTGLVNSLLGHEKTSAKDLAEIEKLLKQMKQK